MTLLVYDKRFDERQGLLAFVRAMQDHPCPQWAYRREPSDRYLFTRFDERIWRYDQVIDRLYWFRFTLEDDRWQWVDVESEEFAGEVPARLWESLDELRMAEAL